MDNHYSDLYNLDDENRLLKQRIKYLEQELATAQRLIDVLMYEAENGDDENE